MNTMRSLASSLWVIDHPLQAMGLDLGARTTIVRLASGGLWMHSPGPLDQHLVSEINALGPVQALIAPNAMHHLYLARNVHAFPEAKVYISPALPPKLTESFPYELLSDTAPEMWRQDIAQQIIGGLPKLQEVVFFHSASRALLITDLAFNIRNSKSWFTRFFMRCNGGYNRFGPTRIFRSLVKDREALRLSLNRVQTWDFDRIIVTHGDVLESDGKQEMQRQYAWV